ncbi:MAG: hypothetical protein MZV63_08820 [Marinilabiliales bacterium]|nr:hypothetical protein [Marinilabiliales bacterium]
MMKETILYIYPEKSTFIQKDINFLSRRYDVVTPGHDWKVKRETPLNFLRQLVFLCRHMRSARAVFVMFGGYWSFLPALLGKITGTACLYNPGRNRLCLLPFARVREPEETCDENIYKVVFSALQGTASG